MAKSHDECSLIVKESMSKFFGEKDLDARLKKFDGLIGDILIKAEKEGVSPEVALEAATRDMTLKIRQEARQKHLNIKAYERTKAQIDQFEKKPWKGIQSLIAVIGGEKYVAETASLYGRREALQNISTSILARGLDNAQIKKLKSGKYDLEIKKILAGELDEAALGKVDPDLIVIATNARKMQDHLHFVKNQAGLNVGYTKNRVGKQFHSGPGMIRYGKEKWKALALERFDFERMGLKTEEEITKRLDDIWTKRTSQKQGYKFISGVSDTIEEVTLQSSTKNLEKGRSVHFKDAESAHIYAKEVNGEQNFMTSLLNEIERDSSKVAAVELLGPSFSANWAKIMSETELSPYRRSSLDSQFNNTVYGSKGRGVGILATGANVSKKLSNMIMLGPKALLSTISDMAFGPHVLSADTGMNLFQSVAHNLDSILRTIPNMKQAALMGSVFSQDALSSTYNTNFHENGLITNWFDKIHDFFMMATGLPMQSRLFKTANANGFNNAIFKTSRNTEFSSLDRGTRNLFDKYGLNESDWITIKNMEGTALPDGRMIVDTMAILDLDLDTFSGTSKTSKAFKRNELATKYNAMLVESAESQSPTPNSQTMHWAEQTDPNSPIGAFARMAAQFKSFTFSMAKTVGRIKGADPLDAKSGSRVASAVIMAMTLKYTADYLKAIYDGKEPPDASDPATWYKIAVGSGVGGIYADMLSVDYSTNIWRDPVKDLAGPGPRVMTDIWKGAINTGKYVYNSMEGDHYNADKNASKIRKQLEKNIALPFVQNKFNKDISEHIYLLLNPGVRR